MTNYNIILWIHTVFAFIFVVSLMVVPFLFHLYENEKGQAILRKIHIVTGSAGVVLLLAGIWMLFLERGFMLSFAWMIVSIALFIIIQIIDHFWADKQEEMLEAGQKLSIWKLKWWSIFKVLGYLFITLLMIVQPY